MGTRWCSERLSTFTPIALRLLSNKPWRSRAAFVTLHQPLKPQGPDLAFAGLDGLVANTQVEAIARHLHRPIGNAPSALAKAAA